MKLIINISDEAYELLKSKSELDNIAESIIANGTPVSTEGDLISRSELKRVINDFYDSHFKGFISTELVTYTKALDDAIDNAPTVDIKDQIAGAYNEGYMCGSREAEKARPQGEWIGDTDYESYQGNYEAYKCNKCGYGLHWRDYCTNEYNFCPNCGAYMGGKE